MSKYDDCARIKIRRAKENVYFFRVKRNGGSLPKKSAELTSYSQRKKIYKKQYRNVKTKTAVSSATQMRINKIFNTKMKNTQNISLDLIIELPFAGHQCTKFKRFLL